MSIDHSATFQSTQHESFRYLRLEFDSFGRSASRFPIRETNLESSDIFPPRRSRDSFRCLYCIYSISLCSTRPPRSRITRPSPSLDLHSTTHSRNPYSSSHRSRWRRNRSCRVSISTQQDSHSFARPPRQYFSHSCRSTSIDDCQHPSKRSARS